MLDCVFGLALMRKDDSHLIASAHRWRSSRDQLLHTESAAMPWADQSGPAGLDLRKVQRPTAMGTPCGQYERSAACIGIDVRRPGHLGAVAGAGRLDLYDKHLR